MDIKFTEDNKHIVITETVKELNPSLILGLDPDSDSGNLDRSSGHGSKWLIRAIPFLISNLILKDWHITVKCKSATIFNEDCYGGPKFLSELMIPQQSTILRWHGGLLMLKGSDNKRIYINLDDIDNITAVKWSGHQKLVNYIENSIRITYNESDRKFIDIKILSSNTSVLEGIVDGYRKDQLNPYRKNISSVNEPIKFMDGYIVNNLAQLEYALVNAKFRVSDSEFSLNETIASIEEGNPLVIQIKGSTREHKYIVHHEVRDLFRKLKCSEAD